MVNEPLRAAVSGRIGLVHNGLLLLLFCFAGYLFDMQILRREEFRLAAESNSMKRLAIRAPRGLLRDREGRVLVKNRPGFSAVVLLDRVSDMDATLARARASLGLSDSVIRTVRKGLRNRSRPELLLKEDLSLSEVAVLEARALEWPEFAVHEGLIRIYPYGRTAAHAFGHMGEIREQQLEEPAFRGYQSGNVVGQSGVEARYESFLRGHDGYRRVLVNSRGRAIREFPEIEPPLPGQDLELTLDLDVQLAAELAFGEQQGAVVAIDAKTGEVLALLSRPAYDPNAFAGKLSSDDWRRYHGDPANPLFDRALLGRLPPGSVFKIVDAIAGLEEKTWDPAQSVNCTGQTILHGDVFRCWKKGGHGVVSFHEALRGSCNVYFYHRGDAVGIDKLALWARRLGLGEKTGIDIDPEGAGLVPDPAWKRRVRGEPWWPGETVSVAIGQGAVGVSVLQVATMMQVVANGGRAFVPHVVRRVGSAPYVRAPEIAREVAIHDGTLNRLRKGLWAVVNETGGTGARARIAGVDVAGKTGTAQAPASAADPTNNREHAWFAGYAPAEQPVAVVAVFVERGGHGGEAAAPIAGAILRRILEKRGIIAAPAPEAPADVAALANGNPPEQSRVTMASTTGRFIGPPRPAGGGANPVAATRTTPKGNATAVSPHRRLKDAVVGRIVTRKP